MNSPSIDVGLQERLKLYKYSGDACVKAMRGEAIPHALGHPLHQICIIRGIRYHNGFGQELRGLLPIFARALNARSIMSNEIPDMDDPDTIPYCIWHPETASVATYRILAQKYPQLVYHVARACAVAGYMELYVELDILPEVHIAEEARECGNLAIYEYIMAQPVQYGIMNDYELSVAIESHKPADLNGDTCVRWMLDIKQGFRPATSDFLEEDGETYTEDYDASVGFEEARFTYNLTEDMQIGEQDTDFDDQRISASRLSLKLLYEPLPRNLPTVQKDILIAMAAYYGDVDRYARLRRPKHVSKEIACCVRGIYHNTLFALYWDNQPKEKKPSVIEAAVNARYIMNNVLSKAPFTDSDTPYLIWWPTPARTETYRRLATIQPNMLPQILRACIYAGYDELFDELLPRCELDTSMRREADASQKVHFREALDAETKRRGLDKLPDPPSYQHWKMRRAPQMATSSNLVHNYLDAFSVGTDFEDLYDGLRVNGSTVETMLCLPEAWKIPLEGKEDERFVRALDYVNWPPPGMPKSAEAHSGAGV